MTVINYNFIVKLYFLHRDDYYYYHHHIIIITIITQVEGTQKLKILTLFGRTSLVNSECSIPQANNTKLKLK